MKWRTDKGIRILNEAAEGRANGIGFPELSETLANKYGIEEIRAKDVIRKALKNNEDLIEENFDSTSAIIKTEAEIIKAAMEGEEFDVDRDFDSMLGEAKSKAAQERDKKLLNKLMKERGKTELLLDTIRLSIQAMPKIKISAPAPVHSNKSEEEALLLFSDAQIGEKITLEETNGLGEYNINIFKDRLSLLTQRIRLLGKENGTIRPVRKLHVAMLGDNVDGINIYRGQEHHLDLNVIDQFLLGTTEIAKAYIHLLDTYEEIKVYGVVGNHGRIGMKGENPSQVNWDFVMYKVLEMLLVAYKDRITFEIPTSNWMIAEIKGQNFLLLHGDTIKGWNGLPYYGIDRADSRLTKMLSAVGKYYRYMCLGHHHNPADIDSAGGEKILNGTMVGGSTFSINTLHTSSRPSQWFFGVNDRGITWRHKILLDEEEV